MTDHITITKRALRNRKQGTERNASERTKGGLVEHEACMKDEVLDGWGLFALAGYVIGISDRT